MLDISLVIHITIGAVALFGGVIALSTRKGSKLHRFSGKVFVLAMTCCAAFGSLIAFLKPELVTVISGFLTCYLIVTSWAATSGQKFQYVFLIMSTFIAVLIGVWSIAGGAEALDAVDGQKHGFPPEPYFIFGGLALFAGAWDMMFLPRTKSSYKNRLARHIWRMCTAMLIAASALLLGQMQVFPHVIRNENILSLPLLVILVLMVFYLARTYFGKLLR